MTMNNKFLNFLGLCQKAGKLSLGADMALDAINKKKSALIMVSSDFSTTSLKKVEKSALKNNIELVKMPYSMSKIEFILNKKYGVISVNDSGFANNFKKLLIFKEDF